MIKIIFIIFLLLFTEELYGAQILKSPSMEDNEKKVAKVRLQIEKLKIELELEDSLSKKAEIQKQIDHLIEQNKDTLMIDFIPEAPKEKVLKDYQTGFFLAFSLAQSAGNSKLTYSDSTNSISFNNKESGWGFLFKLGYQHMKNNYFGLRTYIDYFSMRNSNDNTYYVDRFGRVYNQPFSTLGNIAINLDLLGQYPITKKFGMGLYGGIGGGLSGYDDKLGHYYDYINQRDGAYLRTGVSLNTQAGVSINFTHSSIEAGVLYIKTFGIQNDVNDFSNIRGKYDGDMFSYLITYQYTF